ncbi:MAG: hypothetical protein IPJ41_04495 [Phycisphaerales bacterium]|nr:hypothetical protein [Phycisphaerales bacterium]
MALWKVWIALVGLLVCSVATAQDESKGPSDAELIAGVSRSIVMVEHTFRYDNGEAPEAEPAGMAYRGAEGDMEPDWATLITEERPAERMGYLIAPDLVLTVDPLVDPRFVEKIEVRAGDSRIGAHAEGYAVGQNAMLLRLDAPMVGVEPLEFDAGAEGPFKAVFGRFGNGRWWLTVGPADGQTVVGQPGPAYQVVMWPSLIVSASGTPVSASFNGGAGGRWLVAEGAGGLGVGAGAGVRERGRGGEGGGGCGSAAGGAAVPQSRAAGAERVLWV